MKTTILNWLGFIVLLIMAGCKSGPMSVAAFNPLENIFVNDSAKTLNIDFENAIDSGIIIPSINKHPVAT